MSLSFWSGRTKTTRLKAREGGEVGEESGEGGWERSKVGRGRDGRAKVGGRRRVRVCHSKRSRVNGRGRDCVEAPEQAPWIALKRLEEEGTLNAHLTRSHEVREPKIDDPNGCVRVL